MPFYDEFDLSTVDVLLISQYVLGSFLLVFCIAVDGARRITSSRMCWMTMACARQRCISVFEKQWNIFCILPYGYSDVTWTSCILYI